MCQKVISCRQLKTYTEKHVTPGLYVEGYSWVIEYLNQERSIAGLAFWIVHDNYVSSVCTFGLVWCVRFRAHQNCMLERLFLVRSAAESYISWLGDD